MTATLVIPAASLAGPIERAGEQSASVRSLGIAATDPWADAGRKALGFHFARVLVRLPGLLAGDDPEDVHAMRVASRRMRAAWRVFGDGFDREVARRHRGDLRALGAQLGVVRDLDVHLRILDSHVTARGSRSRKALLPLWNAWSRERRERHQALVGFVTSPAFVAFVTECEALLDPETTVSAPSGGSPALVRSRVPAKAWAAYGDVRAFEERLAADAPADLTTLHELRIATKWLRYTLEFAREPLGDGAAMLIEPVVALQDHLGDQHDLHVTGLLAREFMTGHGATAGSEAAHLDRFATDLERRADRIGTRLPQAWDRVISPRYRSRLGRTIARL